MSPNSIRHCAPISSILVTQPTRTFRRAEFERLFVLTKIGTLLRGQEFRLTNACTF